VSIKKKEIERKFSRLHCIKMLLLFFFPSSIHSFMQSKSKAQATKNEHNSLEHSLLNDWQQCTQTAAERQIQFLDVLLCI